LAWLPELEKKVFQGERRKGRAPGFLPTKMANIMKNRFQPSTSFNLWQILPKTIQNYGNLVTNLVEKISHKQLIRSIQQAAPHLSLLDLLFSELS